MALTSYLVQYLQLSALIFAIEHFPEDTPSRWNAISMYVLQYVALQKSETQDDVIEPMTVNCFRPGQKGKKQKLEFDGSREHCQEVGVAILKHNPEVFEEVKHLSAPLFMTSSHHSPLKPVILTPITRDCCGKRIAISSRPSFPLVYTTQGTRVAAAYHGTCRTCGTRYYSSHSHNSTGCTEYYHNIKDIKYLQLTSATVIELQLLEQVTNTLSFCNANFESVTNTYNANHNSSDKQLMKQLEEYGRGKVENPWMLHKQRLEEGWFLYRIVLYWQKQDKFDINLYTQTDDSNRRNIEELCRAIAVDIAKQPAKWVQHCCTTKGCKEGYATLDGNEKVTRTMCAAPKAKVFIPAGGVSVMQCCPQSPVCGGKHSTASKFCQHHQFLEDGSQQSLDVSQDPGNIALEPIVQEGKCVGKDLPPNDLTASGCCKKDKNVNRYYDRTAGIAAIVRPCGIVVNICEMFTCESMTQMYLFLALTFGHGDDIKRLKYLGYDRACGLEPFLKNRRSEGAYFAKFLLKNVEFLVDKFHCEKHTEPCCMPPSNPECRYHPDLPRFSDIHGCNTECAEQAFRWLNRFKTGLRHMSRFKFNFYLHEMVDTHNTFREQQLKLA